jgi:hypothetical protein
MASQPAGGQNFSRQVAMHSTVITIFSNQGVHGMLNLYRAVSTAVHSFRKLSQLKNALAPSWAYTTSLRVECTSLTAGYLS